MADGKQGWTKLGLVGLFAAFVALAGVWSLPPLDRDESRFAQATAQMLETGDFIAISFQDKERNKKPAGIYWLQAASVMAFSDVEAREIWAYRLPSMLGIIAAAIFTYCCARRLYDQYTAFLAGLLLAAAPVVAAEGTIAKTDGVLLALICLAQWAFAEIYAAKVENQRKGWRYPVLFWAAHGGAVLVKGPIGPMVSFLTGLGLFLSNRRLGWIPWMRPLLGIILLAAMVAPWAWAIDQATDGRFFADAIGGDMVGKIGEVQESHAGPPGYHLLLVWILFWPAAALIGPGLRHIWRDRGQWQAQFLLAWIIPSWIVFEITATKLPHYVMPLYPALAIVAAHAVIKDGTAQTLWRKAGAVTYGAIGLVAAALVAALPVVLSNETASPFCFALAGAIGLASVIIAVFFWRGRAFAGAVAASILAALYAWTLMNGVLPRLDVLTVSPRLSAALEEADRHPLRDNAGPIAIAGYAEPSAVFLIGTETKLTNGATAGSLFKDGTIRTAAVEAREMETFLASAGTAPRTVLAVIDGLNYSNGNPVEITIFISQDDQQRATPND